MASLKDHGEADVEVLDRAGVVALEACLAGMERLAGGLLSRADPVGDCRLFTIRTCGYLAGKNVVGLLFGRRATGFRRDGRRIAAAETDAGPLERDAVVLATGVETPDPCRPPHFAPRIYPVKGYSGT